MKSKHLWKLRGAAVITTLVLASTSFMAPAQAVSIAVTDVSLSVAGVNNDRNTIGITLVMDNEGPRDFNEPFAVRIVSQRPIMELRDPSNSGRCGGGAGLYTCTLNAHQGTPQQPGVARANGRSTFSLEFVGPSPCGRGCSITYTLLDGSGSTNADLNHLNNVAEVRDGHL